MQTLPVPPPQPCMSLPLSLSRVNSMPSGEHSLVPLVQQASSPPLQQVPTSYRLLPPQLSLSLVLHPQPLSLSPASTQQAATSKQVLMEHSPVVQTLPVLDLPSP